MCPQRHCSHETECGFNKLEAIAHFVSVGVYSAQSKGRITLNEIGVETDDDPALSALRDHIQAGNIRGMEDLLLRMKKTRIGIRA